MRIILFDIGCLRPGHLAEWLQAQRAKPRHTGAPFDAILVERTNPR